MFRKSICKKTMEIHLPGEKYLHRGFLWKRRCIFPEGSICTEAFWSSEDTFCRRKVSAQRHLVEEKMHFVRGKYLHRGILWKRRCILSEGSICTEAFWSSADAFCQRKVSAPRLLVEAKMHFSGGKYLHRGFLWKRRYILSEESICTEASCGSADVFFQRKASAQRLFVEAKMHFVRGKYLHRGFLWQRRYILSEESICTMAS